MAETKLEDINPDSQAVPTEIRARIDARERLLEEPDPQYYVMKKLIGTTVFLFLSVLTAIGYTISIGNGQSIGAWAWFSLSVVLFTIWLASIDTGISHRGWNKVMSVLGKSRIIPMNQAEKEYKKLITEGELDG